jgi:pimeloyl-ACP methyl ester carboxylesterase
MLTIADMVKVQKRVMDSFGIERLLSMAGGSMGGMQAIEWILRYPERTREQSEYFGVTLDETLKAGAKARDTVRELLREPFVVRTRRASAATRSMEPRYYAFVELGGKSLAGMMVSFGSYLAAAMVFLVAAKLRPGDSLSHFVAFPVLLMLLGAMLLARHEIAISWRSIDDYLPSIRKVTPEDIQRVAKKYLLPDNRTVGILIPLPPKEGKPEPSGGSIKEKIVR